MPKNSANTSSPVSLQSNSNFQLPSPSAAARLALSTRVALATLVRDTTNVKPLPPRMDERTHRRHGKMPLGEQNFHPGSGEPLGRGKFGGEPSRKISLLWLSE